MGGRLRPARPDEGGATRLRRPRGSRTAYLAALELLGYRTGEAADVPGSGPEAAMHVRVMALVTKRTRVEVVTALLNGETVEAKAATWRLA